MLDIKKLDIIIFLLIFFKSTSANCGDFDGFYSLAGGDQNLEINNSNFRMLKTGIIKEDSHCTVHSSELNRNTDGSLTAVYSIDCADKGSMEGTILITHTSDGLKYSECIRGTTPIRYDNCMIQFSGTLVKLEKPAQAPTEAKSSTAIYCREFKPGGRYLTIDVRDTNPTPTKKIHSPEQVTEALIKTFFEQIGYIILSEDDPRLKAGIHSTLEENITIALGMSASGPGLVLPFDWKSNDTEIRVRVIPTNDVSAFSVSPSSIFVTKGLVKNLLLSAAEKNFGNVDNYKQHLLAALENRLELPEPPRIFWAGGENINSYNEEKPNEIPIGGLIFHWKADSRSTKYNINKLDEFAMDISSSLFFIGAHEAGHLKNKHHEIKINSCEQFRNIEIEADSFAARKLASFIFGMFQWNEDNFGTILNQRKFFEIYKSAGFSGLSISGKCEYPSIEKRVDSFNKEFSREYKRLLNITMMSVRYDKPLGGSSCDHKDRIARSLD